MFSSFPNFLKQEYAIALAENAVDNGVHLKIRREVKNIEENDGMWNITVRHWEPEEYVKSISRPSSTTPNSTAMFAMAALVFLSGVWYRNPDQLVYWSTAAIAIIVGSAILQRQTNHEPDHSDFVKLVQAAGSAVGDGGAPVNVDDMFVGGSGCSRIQHGVTVNTEIVHAKFIVNCAGGASDVIACMIGDHSFKIKPRIGDYILLRKKQVRKQTRARSLMMVKKEVPRLQVETLFTI